MDDKDKEKIEVSSVNPDLAYCDGNKMLQMLTDSTVMGDVFDEVYKAHPEEWDYIGLAPDKLEEICRGAFQNGMHTAQRLAAAYMMQTAVPISPKDSDKDWVRSGLN